MSAVSRQRSSASKRSSSLAEVLVAHRDQRGVIGPDLGDLLRALEDFLVMRPVEDPAVLAGLVWALEPRRRMEGLVRIEALDLQEPLVGAAVALQELECGL